jgi:hypothetical protein
MTSLLEAVRAHAVAHAVTHAGAAGVATTPIPGLMTLTSLAPTEIAHDILRPLVCLVVQGGKHVTQGGRDFAFSAGDSLIITADVPVASRITEASPARPYYSLVLELDLGLVTELSAEMAAARIADPAPVRAEPTDAEVSAAALRLLRLLDRPQALPVLRDQMLRELHYWLLAGRHGSAIRQLGGDPARGVRPPGAGGAPRRGCGHEPVHLPPAFPGRDHALAAAVPEAAAPHRGAAADAAGGRGRRRCRVLGRL